MQPSLKTKIRQYRIRQKRIKYAEYSSKTTALASQLKEGKIGQEEFERAQELLDEQYNYVR